MSYIWQARTGVMVMVPTLTDLSHGHGSNLNGVIVIVPTLTDPSHGHSSNSNSNVIVMTPTPTPTVGVFGEPLGRVFRGGVRDQKIQTLVPRGGVYPSHTPPRDPNFSLSWISAHCSLHVGPKRPRDALM